MLCIWTLNSGSVTREGASLDQMKRPTVVESYTLFDLKMHPCKICSWVKLTRQGFSKVQNFMFSYFLILSS